MKPLTSGRLGRGTLARQLVLRTTALVALVTVALSLFTALASFQILQRQLDDRLQIALGRPARESPRGMDRADPAGSGLIRIDSAGGVAIISASPVADLPAAAVVELLAVPAAAGPTTVHLDGVGGYRVLVRDYGQRITVVGLPWAEVSAPMGRQLGMAGLLTLAAIGLAFFGARQVVERSLRPLNRLAATAAEVSRLPLASGTGVVPVRVPPGDADPDSEVGRVGHAFNHMLDNVEYALAARHSSETKVRQFVADASHELRNPLAAIRGYAELTRRGQEVLPEDAAHALGRIEAEANRMSTLVEDLMLLARLDSQPTLDLGPTDLTQIVLDAVSDARAASRDHEWLLDLPDDPVTAVADRHRLHQVLSNLLGNARTHTPPGTTVTTALATSGQWVLLTVTDDGPGVPEEIRDIAFERFTRADVSRARQAGGSSTGLGLAIVAAVVGAHGGHVRLDSQPGQTRVTLWLPAAVA